MKKNLASPIYSQEFSIFGQLFLEKRPTKNWFLARFRGLWRLNLVLLESHGSPLSISIAQTAPRSPHGTCQELRPWTRFYAVIPHMGTNGLNQSLEIPILVIFDGFGMILGQFSHFYSIFGTFSKFQTLINPFIPKNFRFLGNIFGKNVLLRIGFRHDIGFCGD